MTRWYASNAELTIRLGPYPSMKEAVNGASADRPVVDRRRAPDGVWYVAFGWPDEDRAEGWWIYKEGTPL